MRVTFVLPGFNLSGGIRVAAVHAAHLVRRGHEVRAIALLDPPPTPWQIAKSLLKGHGWPKTYGNGPSHFDGLDVDRRTLTLGEPDPAEVPDGDVVVATWWETAAWIAKLPPAKGARVHFVQGYETFAGDPRAVDAVYALPTPKVVVSGCLRYVLRDKFQQAPLAVVPNAVDLDKFDAPPRGKQPTPTVGFIYSTEHIKGADVILKAFE